MHFLSLLITSVHPLKELLRLFRASEGQHIAVAHDFFIAVDTKDRLGISGSHLAENQAFRLQQGKVFLVGASAHAYPPQHAHRFLRLSMPRSGNSSRSKYGLHHSPTSSPRVRRELSPRRWQPRQENEMPSFFICMWVGHAHVRTLSPMVGSGLTHGTSMLRATRAAGKRQPTTFAVSA